MSTLSVPNILTSNIIAGLSVSPVSEGLFSADATATLALGNPFTPYESDSFSKWEYICITRPAELLANATAGTSESQILEDYYNGLDDASLAVAEKGLVIDPAKGKVLFKTWSDARDNALRRPRGILTAFICGIALTEAVHAGNSRELPDKEGLYTFKTLPMEVNYTENNIRWLTNTAFIIKGPVNPESRDFIYYLYDVVANTLTKTEIESRGGGGPFEPVCVTHPEGPDPIVWLKQSLNYSKEYRTRDVLYKGYKYESASRKLTYHDSFYVKSVAAQTPREAVPSPCMTSKASSLIIEYNKNNPDHSLTLSRGLMEGWGVIGMTEKREYVYLKEDGTSSPLPSSVIGSIRGYSPEHDGYYSIDTATGRAILIAKDGTVNPLFKGINEDTALRGIIGAAQSELEWDLGKNRYIYAIYSTDGKSFRVYLDATSNTYKQIDAASKKYNLLTTYPVSRNITGCILVYASPAPSISKSIAGIGPKNEIRKIIKVCED